MARRQQKTSLPRLLLGGLLPCCLGPAFAAAAQQSLPDDSLSHLLGVDRLSDDSDWTRHFSIGGMAALNIHAKFGMSGNFGISGHNAANGNYDDGYVLTDSTGNAGGQTGYWGYNSDSQYNATTGNLTMHSASSFTGQESANVNDPIDAGFQLSYGDTEFTWNRAKVGWEFGFGVLPISITDHTPIAVTATQTAYVYNTGGILMPGAGYAGGYSGFGEPTIPVAYTNGPATTESGLLTGTRTLNTLLYTVRLGPWLYWDLNDAMALSLGVGPAIGIARNSLDYNETLTYSGGTAINSGSVHSTAFVYGGYANATLIFHAPEKADLFIGGQYMPLSDVNVSGGGRHARLDLGGQIYVTAGINWSF